MARVETVRVVTWNLWWRFDAWRNACWTDPGWTWRRDDPHVAYSHDARIDYVHVGEVGPNGEGAVTSVRVAGDGPVDGIWPSDHLAVVADLSCGQ